MQLSPLKAHAFEYFSAIIVVNGGSNGQGYKTKHIKDRSTGTEGYLEYTKEDEKGKVNQLDVGDKKDQHNYQTSTCI